MSAQLIKDLKATRTLIARGWCQQHMAQDANGEAIRPEDNSAIRFCPIGARFRLQSRWRRTAENKFRAAAVQDAFRDAIGGGSIMNWNDKPDRTQAQVLSAYDRAIKTAGGTP